MPEPSVLDYVKAILGRRPAPEIPALPKARAARQRRPIPRTMAKRKKAEQVMGPLPWRSVLAFALFLIAQNLWAPPRDSKTVGIILALVAIGLTVWAAREGEWRLPKLQEATTEKQVLIFRRVPLALALFFFALTFFFSGGNNFNFVNVTFWVLSIACTLVAFWQTKETPAAVWARVKEKLSRKEWTPSITRWSLLLLGAFVLIAMFRFSNLASMPPEMTSDHAEKLLDVYDISQGKSPIFFERNSGREPFQFYWTFWISQLFDTGISFLSLKLGTALLAFVSLIYVYLLGKEFGGRWVGFFALLLTGFAYWANLLGRVGLRFPLYPTFAAPAIYYLLRGLRRGKLNDFLLSGLFVGIGLHGYTAFRAIPIFVVAALGIFLLHRQPPELRKRALIGFALLTLVSLVVFAPLLRFAIDRPDLFGFRTVTRMFEAERPYPEPAWVTLPKNVMRALTMFNYSGGQIWLVGLEREPAFDTISAALFLLGVGIVAIRYIRHRHWQDILLLVALPFLMLPSTLSLAFPEENPAMNRASGAFIAGFLICALGLDALLHGVKDKLGGKLGLRVAQALGTIILLFALALNCQLFFTDYLQEYDLHSWNTSELGQVIADYAGSFGSLDNAWVVAYPHWVDTRLVGMNAGNTARDYGIWPDQLSNTLAIAPPKLFLLKPEDSVGLDTLELLYPDGLVSTYASRVPGKEFLVFFVPAQ